MAASKPTYYELLELPNDASAQQIKAAFRKLARTYHPDVQRNNPESEALFKQISHAYTILSNPEKRKDYDLLLGFAAKARAKSQAKTGTSPTQAPPSASKSPSDTTAQPKKGQQSNPRTHTETPSTASKTQAKTEQAKRKPPPKMTLNIDAGKFKVLFDTLFEAASTTFSASPATQSKAKASSPPPSKENSTTTESHQRQRGKDIALEVLLTDSEARQGCVKTINVEQTIPCQRCSSTGKVNGQVCPVCEGDGETIHFKKVDVKIPAGLKTGSKIRLAHEGGQGCGGGEAGDLMLTIMLPGHKGLQFDGLQVNYTLDITVLEAVLGTEKDVPTIHGSVKMTIPAGTQPQTVFRLKGQGLSNQHQTGDQLVTVHIVIPKHLSQEQRRLYEALKAFE